MSIYGKERLNEAVDTGTVWYWNKFQIGNVQKYVIYTSDKVPYFDLVGDVRYRTAFTKIITSRHALGACAPVILRIWQEAHAKPRAPVQLRICLICERIFWFNPYTEIESHIREFRFKYINIVGETYLYKSIGNHNIYNTVDFFACFCKHNKTK